MSDDNGTGGDGGANGAGAGDGEGGEGATQTLEQALAQIARLNRENARVRTENNTLKPKASELDRIKAESATEIDKAVNIAVTAEREKAKAIIARQGLAFAAIGKLADPIDATRFIDLASLPIDEEGNLEPKAVSAAIADLLKTKPYLAAGVIPVSGNGSGDGGARGSGPARAGGDMNSIIRRQRGQG